MSERLEDVLREIFEGAKASQEKDGVTDGVTIEKMVIDGDSDLGRKILKALMNEKNQEDQKCDCAICVTMQELEDKIEVERQTKSKDFMRAKIAMTENIELRKDTEKYIDTAVVISRKELKNALDDYLKVRLIEEAYKELEGDNKK